METHKGSCHCGKVTFEATGDLTDVISCNCSICRRKGTLLGFVPDSLFKILSGADALTDYQFGKKKIHHVFCSTCGITTWGAAIAPDGTPTKAINVRCIEGLDLKKLRITEFDGASL